MGNPKGATKNYPPFNMVRNRSVYDICLEKDGITANIIGNTIVSFEGRDLGAVEEMTKELEKHGFNTP